MAVISHACALAGNLADIRYPGQNGTNFDKLQYFYDADGNLSQEIDGIGVTKTYARTDPESLLTGISYGYPSGYGGTQIGPVAFTYDHWGRRASSADSAITSKTYAYDDLDELLSLTTNFGDDSYLGVQGPTGLTLTYAHNPDGSRQNWVANSGGGQGYQYDGVGRLSAAYLFSTGLGSRYSYLANGWLAQTQSVYSASDFNQATPYLEVDRTYNHRGFLRTLTNSLVTNPTVGTSATPLSSFTSMAYDPNGNRLGEVSSVPARGAAPDLSRTVQYGYDTLDELMQEVSTPANSAYNTAYNYTYTYDLSGNPTSSPRLSGAGFNTDNQNTATVLSNGNQAAIAYNGNGDPLALPYNAFSTDSTTFDPEDRLTSFAQNLLNAAYDGDGLRAWSSYGPGYPVTGATTFYLNDGSQPVVEEDYAGEDLFFSLWGATGLEGRYRDYAGAGADPTQIAYSAYTYDPQGNVVQPVSLYPSGGSSGGPVVRVETSSAYDGFGWHSTLAAEDGSDTYDATYEPVAFGGQHGYYRDITGLYLLTHRYYDAGAGRFLTRDPIGYKGGINLYGFAGNNPVNESDPDGTDALIFWGTNVQHGPSESLRWKEAADGLAKDYDDLQGASAFVSHSRPGQGKPSHINKAFVVGSATGLTFNAIQGAMQSHKNIDTIIYVGHAGPKSLYMSPTYSLSAPDVARLDTTNVQRDATIELDGCDTAGSVSAGQVGIAQAFANRFHTTVRAYKGGSSFGVPISIFGREIYRFDPNRPRTLGWQFGASSEPMNIRPQGK